MESLPVVRNGERTETGGITKRGADPKSDETKLKTNLNEMK